MTNAVPNLVEDLTLVPVPVWWHNPWLIALAAVALGLVVRALYRRWRRRPAVPVATPPPPPGPPPHLEALRRLAELRATHAQRGAYPVAIEASDILRTYLERRFEVPIRFQTTREFLAATEQIPGLDDDLRSRLGEWLAVLDRVKFARAAATAEHTLALIDQGEQFVRRGIPAGQQGALP